MSINLIESLRNSRIVSVLVIDEVTDAIPLARALLNGGLDILEVTLRTECALEAIQRISNEVGGVIVGAGTVLTGDAVKRSRGVGAKFIVSPGLTDPILAAAREEALPILPGVATASDVMRGLDHGLSLFKYFPSESIGGVEGLKALNGPFKSVAFCPTGGITSRNLRSYLCLPNVIAVGGSWMVPTDLLRAKAFDQISEFAKEASELARFAAESGRED